VARACLIAAVTLACGFAMLMAVLTALQNKLIFFPERLGVRASPGGEAWITTHDGVTVHAWHLVPPNASRALLYLHGNGGNLESRRHILLQLEQLGVEILAIDYRGYGKSTGEPTEAGLYTDALAAHAWLAQRIPPERIFVYGESLGGGPATELAVKRPTAGLILQSTFTSIADMAALSFPLLPVRAIVRTRFDNLAKLPNVSAPKLIIHSRADEVVPFDMGQRLYAAARGPKQHLWLDRARHNDLYTLDADEVLTSLRSFIASASN